MTAEDEMQAALGSFMLEASELLIELETGLLDLESGRGDEETINSVFRAAHTVKGSAGLFGLEHVVRFTHVVESVLDRLRAQEIPVSAELIGALLPCKDHLAVLIDEIAAGRTTADPDLTAAGATLLARLAPYLATNTTGTFESNGTTEASAGTAEDPADRVDLEVPPGPAGFHLSLRFGPDTLRNGMDPLSFIRYLGTLADVVAIATLADLPADPDELDPERCYLAFELSIRTAADAETIADVFDFVRDDGDIRVLPLGGPVAGFVELVGSAGEHAARIAEFLVRTGAVGAQALAEGVRRAGGPAPAVHGPEPDPEPSAPAGAKPTPSSIGSQNPAQPQGSGEPQDRRQTERRADRAAGTGERQSIRVDADRLDRLIDSVGELVIAGAGAQLRASLAGDEALATALGEVMRLVEEVRDGALQLRMVPIGTTFSRFQRVVRDVSAGLGKDVALQISGGETEVDKALVEQIGDPLMHLVRNALDHGVESPQRRAESGKPARGTLRLKAYHDSGSIVIEVEDDGAGIDATRVLAKAVERGLIDPHATPSEKEIAMILFEPGFSTAAAVSDLSGRGVGMDVVKRNVTALRGSIEVESRPGAGTTFRIRLPLTLAIIDGFLVGVGGATFVIPLDRVVECVELPPGGPSSRRGFMDLRGEVLPFIPLRSLFSIPGQRPGRQNVVVVEHAGAKTGLVVDTLKGEFQTVIKPLGRLFEEVQGIGGSTILGNGDVALIIDVPVLVRSSGQQHATRLVRAR